jgi:hypothetical protein
MPKGVISYKEDKHPVDPYKDTIIVLKDAAPIGSIIRDPYGGWKYRPITGGKETVRQQFLWQVKRGIEEMEKGE